MYGAHLPTTGFSTLIYATVGLVTLAVGATARLIKKGRGK